jgi:2-methylcitrate dehydratase PrpD
MEERHTAREPRDVLGGQYSLPFTTAVALTRDLANPLVYDEAAVRDPLVRGLARRIELDPREEVHETATHVWPAEITIEWAGRTHTLHTRPHKGSPSDPFTWPDVCEKFERYTAPVIPPPRAAALIEAVGRLEKVPDMAEIGELIATRSPQVSA